jgi:hypothetical protein
MTELDAIKEELRRLKTTNGHRAPQSILLIILGVLWAVSLAVQGVLWGRIDRIDVTQQNRGERMSRVEQQTFDQERRLQAVERSIYYSERPTR